MNLTLEFPGVSKQQYVTGRRDCGIKRDTYYILSKQHSSYNDKKRFSQLLTFQVNKYTCPSCFRKKKKSKMLLKNCLQIWPCCILWGLSSNPSSGLISQQYMPSCSSQGQCYPLLCGLANTSHLTHWWNSICHLFSVLMLPGNLTPGSFTNYPTPIFTFRAIRCVLQTLCSW